MYIQNEQANNQAHELLLTEHECAIMWQSRILAVKMFNSTLFKIINCNIHTYTSRIHRAICLHPHKCKSKLHLYYCVYCKARQNGFTVYRPANVNIACRQKIIIHLSVRDKGDLSLPTLTPLDSRMAAVRI